MDEFTSVTALDLSANPLIASANPLEKVHTDPCTLYKDPFHCVDSVRIQ